MGQIALRAVARTRSSEVLPLGVISFDEATGVYRIGDGVTVLSELPSFGNISTDVAAAIADLVGDAPAALDKLNELADALGDDPNFATTILNDLAGKQDVGDYLTPAAIGVSVQPKGTYQILIQAPTGDSTIDRPAIQNALDAVAANGSGTVLLSAGTYALGATGLTFAGSDIVLRGQGKRSTALTYTGSGAALANSDGTVLRRRIAVSDLSVTISAAVSGARGLELENIYLGNFQRVDFRGTGNTVTGIKLIGAASKSTYYNRFESCDVTCDTVCIDIGEQCNGNSFDGGLLSGAATAIKIAAATVNSGQNSFNRVNISTTGATCIDIGTSGTGLCRDTSFTNCRIEIAGSANINLGTSSSRSVFLGGTWSGVTFVDTGTSNFYLIPYNSKYSTPWIRSGRRTTDGTPVNNSTVVVSDDQLPTTVVANTVYEGELVCGYISNTTADIKFTWSLPSGATIVRYIDALPTTAVDNTAARVQRKITGTGSSAAGGIGVEAIYRERVLVVVGATGGTISPRIAQNVADPSNTYLTQDSFLTLRPTA